MTAATDLVTVRLFAAAREAAGVAQLQLRPGPLDAVVADLLAGRSSRFAQVVAISSLVSDGVRLDPSESTPLPAGAVLDVLPPFAGG